MNRLSAKDRERIARALIGADMVGTSSAPDVQPIPQVFRWSPELHHLLLCWFAGEDQDALGTFLPVS